MLTTPKQIQVGYKFVAILIMKHKCLKKKKKKDSTRLVQSTSISISVDFILFDIRFIYSNKFCPLGNMMLTPCICV